MIISNDESELQESELQELELQIENAERFCNDVREYLSSRYGEI